MTSTSGTGFFAQPEESWDVYKDAFAPPPSRPQSKPWERAPVSAHAPRLQGQKIWKRAGLRSQKHNNNKENIDAAQMELEKEGGGARKKVRVLGVKENVEDAPWQEIRVGEEDMRAMDGMMSPAKRDREADVGALLVPRKRTNANHLITPKRATRRIPLENLGDRVGSPLKGRQELQLVGLNASQTPHKSPRKESLKDDVEAEGAANVSPEKPVRRRKSMRKSTSRRLTRSSTEEQSICSAESTADVATVLEMATPDIVETLVQDQIITSVESSKELDAQEIVPPETEYSIEESRTIDESPASLGLNNHSHIAEVTADEEHRTDSTVTEIESSTLSKESETVSEEDQIAAGIQEIPVSVTPINPPAAGGIQETPFNPGQNETGILPSGLVALNSEEVPSSLLLSPTKVLRTPRRGNTSIAQQQVIRRSTRSTRASAVLPGDIQPLEITASPVKAKGNQPSDLKGLETIDVGKLANFPETLESLSTQKDDKHIQEAEPVPEVPYPVEFETCDEDFSEPTAASEENDNVSLEDANQPLSPVCEDAEEITEVDEGNVEAHQPESDEEALTETLAVAGLDDSKAMNNTEEIAEAEPEEMESSSPSPEPVSDEETVTIDLAISESQLDMCLAVPFSNGGVVVSPNQPLETAESDFKSDDASEEDLEEFEPVSIPTVAESILDNITASIEDLPESTTPDPSTTALVETISDNAPSTNYNEDDTDLLRNFLTRVKANKEAKANSTTTKRKRSLPHSPIRLPLGGVEANLSPSSPQSKNDFDVSLPAPSPTKRRKRGEPTVDKDDMTEPQSIRRSGRTRLPVKTATVPAPSFIPVRRLGQDGDNTITLRRNEEKELAALTKINTRKNKSGALPAMDVIGKMGMQKDDPALRHQALKQKFDEKTTQSQKPKKKKSVVWAEEIAQYQTADGKIVDMQETEKGKEKLIVDEKKKVAEEKKSIPVRVTTEEKKSAPVRVGVKSSRISMGMAANGTPAPKRKVKGVVRS